MNLPDARPMTYSEREALIDAGLDPVFMEDKASPKWERQLIRWILENVYTGTDFSKAPFPACRDLAFKTYEITIKVTQEEEKNS